MECNIDRRGRIWRLVCGVILDLCGVAMIVAGVLLSIPIHIAGGAVLSAIGSFTIFEGVRGWCALRALGIKTPL